MLFMNSRGGADEFGLVRGNVPAVDVPVLNTPVAIQFIHSYSMRAPADRSTVAGAWLSHGAYAYIGSMAEPYLAAFVPTLQVTERLVNFVPFIISCRWWIENSPFARPWRVSTFGDPLMLAPAPSRFEIKRITPPLDNQVDLRSQAANLMKIAVDSNDLATYTKAIEQLVLIGEDQLAIDFWQIARQHGAESAGSTTILGPLFRERQRRQFLVAWLAASNPDALDRDMLWHLYGSELTFETDPKIIDALAKNLRRRSRGIDLTRVAPYLARAQSKQVVRDLASAAMKNTKNKRATERYEKLLKEY